MQTLFPDPRNFYLIPHAADEWQNRFNKKKKKSRKKKKKNSGALHREICAVTVSWEPSFCLPRQPIQSSRVITDFMTNTIKEDYPCLFYRKYNNIFITSKNCVNIDPETRKIPGVFGLNSISKVMFLQDSRLGKAKKIALIVWQESPRYNFSIVEISWWKVFFMFITRVTEIPGKKVPVGGEGNATLRTFISWLDIACRFIAWRRCYFGKKKKRREL